MDIDMRIDRLVVEGPPLDTGQREALLHSLKTELARLLAGSTGWTSSAAGTLQGADVAASDSAETRSVGAGADRAAGLGRSLARAIYEGIRA